MRGFTLIEVLIALVIASIGVLGVAALSIQAIRGASDADQRTLMRVLTTDLQERAWIHGRPSDRCDETAALFDLPDLRAHPLIADGPMRVTAVAIERHPEGCRVTFTQPDRDTAQAITLTRPGRGGPES